MANTARFLRIQTGAGFHGAFQAANGEKVWTTEVYPHGVSVIGAIRALVSTIIPGREVAYSRVSGCLVFAGVEVPLVDVDERVRPTPGERYDSPRYPGDHSKPEPRDQ